MTATLSMVPLAQIRPSKANPRAEFDDERMAELIESVKRHGIITPLTLSRDGDGRYAIIAGERRYRAAKAAKLREVPAQVREVDGDALTLAVAENVIRADLSPLEEARAYRRLVDEHGDAAKVAKLVGKSERLVERAPRPPAAAGARRRSCSPRARLPLACAPALVRIAEREPLLADLTARVARGASARRGGLPGRTRARSWTTCSRPSGRTTTGSRFTRSPTASAATTARSSRAAGARGRARGRAGEARRARGGGRGRLRARCRRSRTPPSTTGQAREARGAARARVLRPHRRGRRRRARVRLSARTRRGRTAAAITATSPIRSGSRIGSCRRSPRTSPRRPSGRERERERARRAAGGDDAEKEARRRERERQYEERVSAPRAQPRPRRGARALAAEARHGRRQAARLARARCTTARRRRGRTGSASSSRRRRTSRAR